MKRVFAILVIIQLCRCCSEPDPASDVFKFFVGLASDKTGDQTPLGHFLRKSLGFEKINSPKRAIIVNENEASELQLPFDTVEQKIKLMSKISLEDEKSAKKQTPPRPMSRFAPRHLACYKFNVRTFHVFENEFKNTIPSYNDRNSSPEFLLESLAAIAEAVAFIHLTGHALCNITPKSFYFQATKSVKITDLTSLTTMDKACDPIEGDYAAPETKVTKMLQTDQGSQMSDVYVLGLIMADIYSTRNPSISKSNGQKIFFQKSKDEFNELKDFCSRGIQSINQPKFLKGINEFYNTLDYVICSCLDPDPVNRPSAVMLAFSLHFLRLQYIEKTKTKLWFFWDEDLKKKGMGTYNFEGMKTFLRSLDDNSVTLENFEATINNYWNRPAWII